MASKRAIALVSDLLFAVKIREAAARAGSEVVIVKSLEQAMLQAEKGASLLILDLNMAGIDPIEIIASLKRQPQTKGIHLLGFLSHVQTDLRKTALEAGCDEVVPRSAFSRHLVEILARA